MLAVSAAVPTIAFSGVTDVQQEAWDLVEGLAPAYGDHWWYISLLAFTRQDQGLFEEAEAARRGALSCEPSSGHAVHAQTHVLYETGRHEVGRVWLDHWVAESGRSASHRAHFSWHAALHELALGDTEAVRRRYYSQLAAPEVTGVRALVDSASLLWRWRTTTDWDPAVALGGRAPPGAPGRSPNPRWPGPRGRRPGAAGPPADPVRRAARRDRPTARPATRPSLPATWPRTAAAPATECCAARCATLCQALQAAVVEARWSDAATLIEDVLPVLARVGGSAAQREVVEETPLIALVNAGHQDRAMRILDERLHRRPSPLDQRRRCLAGPGATPVLT